MFPVLQFFEKGGWIGVDLFFVLSGFLIANLFYREIRLHGDVQPFRFLARRAFKIYPLFWAFIGFTVWAQSLEGMPWGAKPFEMFQVHSELLFLQNYWLGWYPMGLWPHTWSLATEEQFYLLIALMFSLPALDRGLGWKNLNWIPWVALLALILCPTLRILSIVHSGKLDAVLQMYPTHVRLDGFFMGVLLCHGLHHGWRWLCWSRRTATWILCLSLVALLPNFILGLGGNYYVVPIGLSINAIAGASLLHSTQTLIGERLRWWWRVPCFFGRHSYGIYLWHVAAYRFGTMFTKDLLHWESYGAFLLHYILDSLLIGTMISIVIERPFLRIRDRCVPSRSVALDAEQNAFGLRSVDSSPFAISGKTIRQVTGVGLCLSGLLMILANGPHRIGELRVGDEMFTQITPLLLGKMWLSTLLVIVPAGLGILVFGGLRGLPYALWVSSAAGLIYALLLSFMVKSFAVLWHLDILSGRLGGVDVPWTHWIATPLSVSVALGALGVIVYRLAGKTDMEIGV